MKKIGSLFFVVLLTFCVIACSSSNSSGRTSSAKKLSTSQVQNVVSEIKDDALMSD